MKITPQDHFEITQLLARYCLALDRDDIEGCVALFAPDAVYETWGRTFEGHDGLRRLFSSAPGGLHLGGTPVIERVEGDRATTQQNLLFVDRTTGASRSALYTDELVRTAVGWRIARRRCRFHTRIGLADRPDRRVERRHDAAESRLVDS